MTKPARPPTDPAARRGTAGEPPPRRPWRTEGLTEPAAQRRRRRMWIGLLLGWFVIFGLTTAQDAASADVATISYTEFTEQVEQGNVVEVFSRGQTIEGTLEEPAPRPGEEGSYDQFVTERPAFAEDDLLEELEASGAVVAATPVTEERGLFSNLLISLLPMALLVAFYVWLFRRQRGAGGMGGGLGGLMGGSKKSRRVDPEQVRVTFADVAGIDEVEGEVAEIVDFLKHPEKYTRLGARVPRGVLLEGGPGTGKTLLARATAGEAEVPFFSASAAEFIEMIVGVGAQRVRELFAEARAAAPAIVFIDEIDTIGRSRASARSLGGNDEREQTLNQILTEMDGFSGSEGVVVIAATNRAEILDPALTRPGRFDRTITVSAPDQAGREEILRVHTRGVPLGADVHLGRVARSTPGMTGAELANLVNEAALLAARREQREVRTADFSDALERVQLGAARPVVLLEEERVRTAYHEAGHALLGMLQPGADPVRKVSIIPRGRALGVTLATPESDRYGYDAEYLRGRIVGALGGMAAEQEVLGVTTTGSEADLRTATSLARQMVGRWGMSARIGPVQVYPDEGDPRQAGASEALLEAVDAEVREILERSVATARRLLAENRDKLEGIAAALLEHETLDEADAYAAAGFDLHRAGHQLTGPRV